MKTHTTLTVGIAARLLPVVALILAGLTLSATASATSYTFTELIPLSGGASSSVSAINNLGQVVGTTNFTAPCYCPGTSSVTLWDSTTGAPLALGGNNSYNNGRDINDVGQVVGYGSPTYTTAYNAFVTSSTPAGATSLSSLYYNDAAFAINNLGQVAGRAFSYDGYGAAFVWDTTTGTVTYLGADSSAFEINDAGQVVGSIGSNAVLWNGTTVNVLDSLGGNYSSPEAINNAGQVVGTSLTGAGAYHATLWNGTTATDLGTLLSGSTSFAHGINNFGHVVGEYSGLEARAFLWDGSTMADLNSYLDASTVSAGWVLNSAQDINDKGQIIGTAKNSITGVSSAYILTPVPEPETYIMMLAGLGLVGAAARRRKQA